MVLWMWIVVAVFFAALYWPIYRKLVHARPSAKTSGLLRALDGVDRVIAGVEVELAIFATIAMLTLTTIPIIQRFNIELAKKYATAEPAPAATAPAPAAPASPVATTPAPPPPAAAPAKAEEPKPGGLPEPGRLLYKGTHWVSEHVWESGAEQYDLAKFCLLWLAFLGASLATRERRHISIDIVTKIVPRRVRAGLGAASSFVAAVACVVLLVVSTYLVRENWTSAIRAFSLFSRGQAELVYPVALGIMSFRFLIVGIEDLRGFVTGDLAYLATYEHAEGEHGTIHIEDVAGASPEGPGDGPTGRSTEDARP